MDQRKTILFVDTGTQGGGTFVGLMTLLRQMDRDQFRPVVCCFNPRSEDDFNALDVPLFVLSDPLFSCRPAVLHKLMRAVQAVVNRLFPFVRPLFERVLHAGAILGLKGIATRVSADLMVLNTHVNRELFGLYAAQKIGVPVVSHLQSRNGRGLTPALAAYANGQVRRMIANSQACRDYWVGLGLDADKIDVIPNAVSLEAVEAADLQSEFGLPDDVPVICCAGRLIDIKGQDVLLRALARLKSHVCVLLVGDGMRRQRFETLADELGVASNVTFTGWRTDARSFMAASDLVVQPSREEALGLTLLEGMSQGVPVIGGRVGGIPEVIDEGVNGLLCEPGDAESLAVAIDQLLSDEELRQRLADAGRQTVVRKFSPEAYAKSTEQMYIAAMKGRS